MICLAISILQCAVLASSALSHAAAREPPTHYTIQVLSVRLENRQNLLPVCQSLRAKGHLAYCCPKRIGDRQYVRLRVGIFDQRAPAEAFARELERNEGLNHLVTKADVPVVRFGNRRRLVTTPSGIWLASPEVVRELYAPTGGWIDMVHTIPQISPDGSAIAFYADQRILKIALDTGETQVLQQARHEDDLLHSVVRWSPEGRFLAYLDAVEWELPTKLWVVRADGAEGRCLVGDDTGQTKVKSFAWHPYRSRIFYVSGPTHGTVSVGGSLNSVDLDGTCRTLVAARLPERTEVHSQFRIADGVLEYRIAHHRANGAEPVYTSHQYALSDRE